MNEIGIAFLTGITTGGISCIAVQGGLLATSRDKNIFLASKLIAYTILGALLGFVGSLFILSIQVQAWMQILIGIFMIITALQLLNLHPIFRKFLITPPKFIVKLTNNKHNSWILGTLTILIPCGVTQAIIALALSTGNPINAALIMFAFTLGTTPLFFIIGVTANKIFKKRILSYAGALVVLVLGVLAINNGQVLRNSPHTIQNYKRAILSLVTNSDYPTLPYASIGSDGKQELRISVAGNGYSSNAFNIKSGVPVKLKLITNGGLGCTKVFNMPEYNITKVLPDNGEEIIEFTPTKPGLLTYACGMGMYTGNFNVVN